MIDPTVVPPPPAPEGPADPRIAAAQKAVAFRQIVANAQAKSGDLDRKLLTQFAFGAANLMLAEIVAGVHVPKDAKQAAEVAKIALEIGRTETGEGPATPEEIGADARRSKIDQANALYAELQARGREAAATVLAPGRLRAVPDTEIADDTFDLTEDVP